jgi:hypothetical protein
MERFEVFYCCSLPTLFQVGCSWSGKALDRVKGGKAAISPSSGWLKLKTKIDETIWRASFPKTPVDNQVIGEFNVRPGR